MTDNTQGVIEVLERIEAATRANAVPPAYRWIGAAQVAAMLDTTPRNFAERYACRPDFPKPSRPGGPNGERRWNMAEVQRFMEKINEAKR